MVGKRFQVGDVFAISLDNERVSYAQIVHRWGNAGGHFYVAVFEGVYAKDDRVDLAGVTARPVVLFALTMDALLVVAHWRVVGRHTVSERDLPWAAYKEGISPPGGFEVVDYTGKRRRAATEDEVTRLAYRTVVAPIRVEKDIAAIRERFRDVREADRALELGLQLGP